MDELRLSRSRESRVLVAEPLNGELPLIRYEGRADLGFGPKGGEEPEAISCLPEQLPERRPAILPWGGWKSETSMSPRVPGKSVHN